MDKKCLSINIKIYPSFGFVQRRDRKFIPLVDYPSLFILKMDKMTYPPLIENSNCNHSFIFFVTWCLKGIQFFME